jgi:hypothetical protein
MQRTLPKAKKFLSEIDPSTIKLNDKIIGAHGRRGKIANIRTADDGEYIFDLEWNTQIEDEKYSSHVSQWRCSKVEYRGKSWADK